MDLIITKFYNLIFLSIMPIKNKLVIILSKRLKKESGNLSILVLSGKINHNNSFV